LLAPVGTAVEVGRDVPILRVRVGFGWRRRFGCGSQQTFGGLGTESKMLDLVSEAVDLVALGAAASHDLSDRQWNRRHRLGRRR